jgi:hypothetical protein
MSSLYFIKPIFPALLWRNRAHVCVPCLKKANCEQRNILFCKFGGIRGGAVESSVLLRRGATCQKREAIVYDFVCISISTNGIEKCFKFSDGTFV